MPVLLTTAYFPPLSYFAAIAAGMGGIQSYKGEGRRILRSSPLTSSVVYIEVCENFQKQSYRNRCRFYAADGVQSLSVPIVHDKEHPCIADIRIDYAKPWMIQHKRAIVSAYQTSAYFEYYKDELFSIFDSKPETLLELNLKILRFFIEKTGLSVDLRTTSDYAPSCPDGSCVLMSDGDKLLEVKDLRNAIHPKREDDILESLGLEKPYFQVFARKYGFKSNLSIMDLLFNEGPNSIVYLYNLNAPKISSQVSEPLSKELV